MKSIQDKTAVFETVPVRQAVRMQIVPAIASQMIALIYNLADTYFVGMLNQPDQTAAVTAAYSSFVMLTAISNLFGVGGASALSRASVSYTHLKVKNAEQEGLDGQIRVCDVEKYYGTKNNITKADVYKRQA